MIKIQICAQRGTRDHMEDYSLSLHRIVSLLVDPSNDAGCAVAVEEELYGLEYLLHNGS